MKNKTTTILIAIIPAMGHVYLGLYKKALIIFFSLLLIFVFYILVIIPNLIDPILSGITDKTANNIVSFILYFPITISYVWSIIDAALQTDILNRQKLPEKYHPIKLKKQ